MQISFMFIIFRPTFLKIMIIEKMIFPQIGYFFDFYLYLRPGSIKIERGMKEYFRGLILTSFGPMGSSLVPGEGPRGWVPWAPLWKAMGNTPGIP